MRFHGGILFGGGGGFLQNYVAPYVCIYIYIYMGRLRGNVKKQLEPWLARGSTCDLLSEALREPIHVMESSRGAMGGAIPG